MFKNIYYDAYKSKIHLWESFEGRQIKNVYDVEYSYFEQTKRETKTKDIFDNYVMKKIAKDNDMLKNIKECGGKLHESDLPQDIKFLHDRYSNKKLNVDVNDFQIAYIDIEIASENEFPKPDQVKYPINLITVKYSKTNEVITYGTSEYTGNKIKNYHYCQDENMLMDRFISYFRKQKVDIVSGWYIKGFDLPYIIRRAEKIGVDKTLSPLNKYIENKKTGEFRITGLTILDYIDLYKKYTQMNRESYSLNFISNLEIGEGKLDLDGTMNTIYKTNWNQFAEYNVQDVLLVEKLDMKLKYIELTITMAYQSMIPIDKVDSSIVMLTGYVLKEMHEKNIVMPDRVKQEAEPFSGAYVYAKKGMHKNVMSFDVTSLYPTIIRLFNISPDTIISSDEVDKIERLKKEGNLITTPNENVFYDKSFKGIIPSVTEKIFNERIRYKKLMKEANENNDSVKAEYYNRMQYIHKIIINSLYGCLAHPFFNLYDIRNASMVTNCGQHIIKYLATTTDRFLKENFITHYEKSLKGKL